MTVDTSGICLICGIVLPLSTGRGRPRKLCGSVECVAADRSARRASVKLRDICAWCHFELPGARRSTLRFCRGTSCQKDYEWAARWDDQHRRRPWRSSQVADGDFAEEVAHAEGDLNYSATEMSMAEAELAAGECVIHKAYYEPMPARKGKVLNGTCDFDPELFRAEDGSLPEWLHSFMDEYPQPGSEVGFSVTVQGGSYRPWEQRPYIGQTLGSWI